MSVIELNEKKELRRKVTRFGNSMGITIPNEFIQAKGIQPGDEFDVCMNEHGEFVLKPVPKIPLNVSPDVLELFAETLREYDDVMRTLKDR